MNTISREVLNHLKPLIGLKLSIARRAANMSNFQFGQVREVDRGTVGEYALHVDCPWRLEGPHGIVTGWLDLWEPAEETGDDFDWPTWTEEKKDNLQEKRLGELLGGYDEQTHSVVNVTANLEVGDVQTDAYGGAVLRLSDGSRLVLFPAGSRCEDWRIFQPQSDGPHFVVAGGKVEDQE
jgi:hypothetical protein